MDRRMSVECWGVEQGLNLSQSTQRGPVDSTNKALGRTKHGPGPESSLQSTPPSPPGSPHLLILQTGQPTIFKLSLLSLVQIQD